MKGNRENRNIVDAARASMRRPAIIKRPLSYMCIAAPYRASIKMPAALPFIGRLLFRAVSAVAIVGESAWGIARRLPRARGRRSTSAQTRARGLAFRLIALPGKTPLQIMAAMVASNVLFTPQG